MINKIKLKSVAFAALLTSTPLCAMAQDGFTINATLPGMPDSTFISLSDIEHGKEPITLAKGYVMNGKAVLKGKMTGNALCKLLLSKHNSQDDSYQTANVRVLMGNENVNLSSDSKLSSLSQLYEQVQEEKMQWKGSNLIDQWNEYVKKTWYTSAYAEEASFEEFSKKLLCKNNPDSLLKYRVIYTLAESERQKANIAFIKEHPDYTLSAILATNAFQEPFAYDKPTIEEIVKLVSENCEDTARVEKMKKASLWALEHAKYMHYKDFALTTDKGTSTQLSALIDKEKYTLIDFWASWCLPCRAAMPRVQEIQKAFGNQLQVIAISIDKDNKAWKKAVKEEKATWTQGWLDAEQDKVATPAYNVLSIPRLILIDKEGRVVLTTNNPEGVNEYMQRYAKQFRITSQIGGLKDGTIVHLYNMETAKRKDGDEITSTTVKNGQFELQGNVPQPTYARVDIEVDRVGSDGKPYHSTTGTFLMLENTNYTMTAAHIDSIALSFRDSETIIEKEINVKTVGGKAQQEYNDYRQMVRGAELAYWKNYYKAWTLEFQTDDAPQDSIDYYNDQSIILHEKMDKAHDDYVMKHSDTAIGAYLLQQQLASPYAYTLDQVNERINLAAKTWDIYRQANIMQHANDYRAQAKGMPYKNVKLMDEQMQSVELKDYIKPGKYTLVDFWASWCGPCLVAVPMVKDIAKQYGDRLNVLSITLDRREKDWKEALKREQMPWTQLSMPKDQDEMMAVFEAYGFNSIPFMVLIDDQGKIECIAGSPIDISDRLQQIFKK